MHLTASYIGSNVIPAQAGINASIRHAEPTLAWMPTIVGMKAVPIELSEQYRDGPTPTIRERSRP
jgi:hypothetical protein